MTMQHQNHPDDERLAALAGGDADATADAGLRAHVSACDQCGPMVAELAQLRTALAELPDLVPSRPLQLLPPVPAVPQRAQGGWLRRIAAPMLAAGAMLVLVGTVGGSGVLSSMATGLGGAGAAAAPSAAASFAEDQAGDREVRDRFPFPVNLFFAFRSRESRSETPELSGGIPSPADVSSGSGGSKASHQPAATGQPAPSHAPAGPPEAAAQAVLSINGWGVVLLIGVLGVMAGGVVLLTTRPAGP